MKKQSPCETLLTTGCLSFLLCSYLPKEDILNLSQVSKDINESFTKNNILQWIILSNDPETLPSNLFKLQNKFELMNKDIIESISNTTDNIFNAFYNQTNRMIKCYYFSFILFGLDLYSLVIAFVSVKKTAEYLTQIPFMFNWLSAVICLIIYNVRANRMKKRIRDVIMENKGQLKGMISERDIKELTRKLKLRTKSRKPTAFQQAAIAYVIFYTPVIIKTCITPNGSFKKTFYASSSMIFIYLFLSTLGMIIRKKIKHRNTKIVCYERLFKDDPEYIAKTNEITVELKNQSTSFGEVGVTSFFLLVKLIYYFLLLFYLDCLGKKLDDDPKAYSWFALFSPIYLLDVFVISWGILHCCSLKNLVKENKTTLYVSLTFIILCMVLNSIFIPFKLEDKLDMSYLWSAGCFLFGTVSLVFHYVLLCKRKIETW